MTRNVNGAGSDTGLRQLLQGIRTGNVSRDDVQELIAKSDPTLSPTDCRKIADDVFTNGPWALPSSLLSKLGSPASSEAAQSARVLGSNNLQLGNGASPPELPKELKALGELGHAVSNEIALHLAYTARKGGAAEPLQASDWKSVQVGKSSGGAPERVDASVLFGGHELNASVDLATLKTYLNGGARVPGLPGDPMTPHIVNDYVVGTAVTLRGELKGWPYHPTNQSHLELMSKLDLPQRFDVRTGDDFVGLARKLPIGDLPDSLRATIYRTGVALVDAMSTPERISFFDKMLDAGSPSNDAWKLTSELLEHAIPPGMWDYTKPMITEAAYNRFLDAQPEESRRKHSRINSPGWTLASHPAFKGLDSIQSVKTLEHCLASEPKGLDDYEWKRLEDFVGHWASVKATPACAQELAAAGGVAALVEQARRNSEAQSG